MSNELTNLSGSPGIELAPSQTREEAPYVTRMLGGLGLFLFVVGGASALAAAGLFGNGPADPITGIEQPRGLFSLGVSYLLTLLALVLMLIHAVSDSDIEIRRL